MHYLGEPALPIYPMSRATNDNPLPGPAPTKSAVPPQLKGVLLRRTPYAT